MGLDLEGIVDGTDTLSQPGRRSPSCFIGSGGYRRNLPRPISLGSQAPKSSSGNEMGLDIEGVVDGGVSGEESFVSLAAGTCVA